jgi:hypothetical protein
MVLRILGKKLKAQDLFDSLDREKKQGKDRKIMIRPSRDLVNLIRPFAKALLRDPYPRNFDDKLHEENYSRCEKSLPKEYCSKDIEKFSLILIKYQKRKYFGYYAGLYLSLLINNCRENNIVIHTRYDEDLFRLGFENKASLVINGDAGDNLGMKNSGEIIVIGDAGDWLGDKNSGRIIVNGNAGHIIGSDMKGGEIIINGDCKDGIGSLMQGGVIHLNGKYGRIEERLEESDEFWPVRGEIYHKGKLIVRDGWLL